LTGPQVFYHNSAGPELLEESKEPYKTPLFKNSLLISNPVNKAENLIYPII
jgi:hypothetical protein